MTRSSEHIFVVKAAVEDDYSEKDNILA